MDQLKRLRTEKGLSQAKLAALADIDPSTVNQIERGAREASPATLRKLAQALDVSLAELLEDNSPKAGSRSSLEPSLDDVLEDLRRTTGRFQSYHETQKAMDEYRELWERRLSEEDLDKNAFEEAGRAIRAFWPAVTTAADAEIDELKRFGAQPEEVVAQSVLLPAIARFQALGERVNSTYREKFRQAPASNVYAFPRREVSSEGLRTSGEARTRRPAAG